MKAKSAFRHQGGTGSGRGGVWHDRRPLACQGRGGLRLSLQAGNLPGALCRRRPHRPDRAPTRLWTEQAVGAARGGRESHRGKRHRRIDGLGARAFGWLYAGDHGVSRDRHRAAHAAQLPIRRHPGLHRGIRPGGLCLGPACRPANEGGESQGTGGIRQAESDGRHLRILGPGRDQPPCGRTVSRAPPTRPCCTFPTREMHRRSTT